MTQAALLWCLPGLLGTMGGLASLAMRRANSPPFTLGLFVSRVVLAFFVGTLTGELIDDENKLRTFYILIAGFFAYQVMVIIESRLKATLDRILPGDRPQ